MQHIKHAPQTESALEKATSLVLSKKGVLSYKFSSPNKKGVPDRLYIVKGGHVIFCEFKSPLGKGMLSELQVHQIKKMTDVGANVWVVGSVDQANVFIDHVLSHRYL